MFMVKGAVKAAKAFLNPHKWFPLARSDDAWLQEAKFQLMKDKGKKLRSWLDYHNIFMYLGELHLHHYVSSWLWKKGVWHLPVFTLYFSNSRACGIKSVYWPLIYHLNWKYYWWMVLILQQWTKDFPQKGCLNLDFSPALSSLEQLPVRSCTWLTFMEGWNSSVRAIGGIFTLLHMGEAGQGAGVHILTEGPNV